MNVGMVCPYSLTIPGGVQNQVIALTKRLRNRGHHVTIIAPCDGPPPLSGVIDLGTTVLNPSNGSMAPIAPGAKTQRLTLQALRDYSFDVIHLHEPLVPGPTVTAAVMKPAPLVGTFHAAGDDTPYKKLAPLARGVGGRIDVKIAVSQAAQALASTALAGPWQVWFNGVELEQFAHLEPRSQTETAPSVLFVGRHEERKGLGVLLEAFSQVDIPAQLWVAGTGPETASLRTRYGHDARISWLGRISDAERNQRMREACVFVAPALGGESFGIILVEAMAAGAALVASDIEGFRAVVTTEHNDSVATLVEPGNPEQLRQAMVVLLERPELRAHLENSAIAHAQQFSMERLTGMYEAQYEALVSGRVTGAADLVNRGRQ